MALEKKNLTTDDAKKTKLPSGTRVVSTPESFNAAVKTAEERIQRVEDFKKKTQNVPKYNADLTRITKTLNEIQKEVDKQAQSDYAVRNIYVILQDSLKKVRLSQN